MHSSLFSTDFSVPGIGFRVSPSSSNDFLFAEVSVPKPPEIENGYVQHLIRYQCKPLYRLRTEGDGKTWTSVPAPSSAPAFL